MFLTVLPLLMMAIGSFHRPLSAFVAAHGHVDRNGALPRRIEQIQRFMLDRPFADGEIFAAGEQAETGQYRKRPLHRFQPDHILSQEIVNACGATIGNGTGH